MPTSVPIARKRARPRAGLLRIIAARLLIRMAVVVANVAEWLMPKDTK
jgi:hypothetical protein